MRAGTAAGFAGAAFVVERAAVRFFAFDEFGEITVVAAVRTGVFPDEVAVSGRAAVAEIGADDLALAALRTDFGFVVDREDFFLAGFEAGLHILELGALGMFAGRLETEGTGRWQVDSPDEESVAAVLCLRFTVSTLRAEKGVVHEAARPFVAFATKALGFAPAIRTDRILAFVCHRLPPRRF